MANLKLLFLYLSFNIMSTLPSRGTACPPNSGCVPSGNLWCWPNRCPRSRFPCSPPMPFSTRSKLTNSDYSEGGDGGRKSECDGQYHDNSKPIVALSTGLYENGSRCGKMIRITANNGKSVLAKVVGKFKFDSMRGRDNKHNIVDGSDGVWNALGLDKSIGEVDVSWSMA